MKKFLFVGCLLGIIICPVHGFAARNITIPYELKFDSGDDWTSDLRWVAGGATGTHVTSGCWSGGCAKFTPPTSAQTYAGLGAFSFSSQNHLNVRALVKVGSTYTSTAHADGYGTQNKFIIITPSGAGERGMTIFQAYEDNYYTFGACNDNDCLYECGGTPGQYWPCGNDAFKSSDYPGEWFCIELEVDYPSDSSNVYIWTQDGKLNGLYKTSPLSASSAFNGIQIIGGFYNGYHTSDSNTYVMFDEIKISNSYIGPPAGFVEGKSAPNPPGVLRIVP